ncbi:PREDICTED: zinc finger protein 236-like [Priapulus caudatus]|uniref:Zinc finger protein 236-like n=1 Tax=Priapulus caudatus TaxID=37621 RepID=A0ABM1E637_PRICU|nr:PREDICTED: zinc finger protein 236-like [Priapulus caudatus]
MSASGDQEEYLTVILRVVGGVAEEYQHSLTLRVDSLAVLFCPACGNSFGNKLDYIGHIRTHTLAASGQQSKPMPLLQPVQLAKPVKRPNAQQNPFVSLSDIMLYSAYQEPSKRVRVMSAASPVTMDNPSAVAAPTFSTLSGFGSTLSEPHADQSHGFVEQQPLMSLSLDDIALVNADLDTPLSRALSEISDYSDLQSVQTDVSGLQESGIFLGAAEHGFSVDAEKKKLIINLHRLPEDVIEKFKQPQMPSAHFARQQQQQQLASASDLLVTVQPAAQPHVGNQATHTNKPDTICQQCGKLFQYRMAFLKHIQSCKTNGPFKCKMCGMQFPVGLELRKHMDNYHRAMPLRKKKESMKGKVGRGTSCQLCGKVMQKGALLAHLSEHSEMNSDPQKSLTSTYKLVDAPPAIPLEPEVITSAEGGHIDESVQETVERLFNDYRFEVEESRPGAGTVTEESAAGGSIFHCRPCELGFDAAQLFYDHCLAHTDARCPICERSLPDGARLRQHVHRHIACHRCSVCSLLFPGALARDTHATVEHLVATATRRVDCHECNTAFADDESYMSHVVRCHNLQPKIPLMKTAATAAIGKPCGDGSLVNSGQQMTVTNGEQQMTVADAGQQMTMTDGERMIMTDGGQVTVTDGGQMMVVTDGGQMTVTDGGQMTMTDGGQMTMTDGGQQMIVTNGRQQMAAAEEVQQVTGMAAAVSDASHPHHRCQQCGATFKSKVRYNTHLAKVHQQQPYKCTLCCHALETKTDYVAHLSAHASDGSPVGDGSNGGGGFSCYVCAREYGVASKCQQHLFRAHGVKPYLCQLCGEHLEHINDLLFHLDNHSKENTTAAEGAPVEIAPSVPPGGATVTVETSESSAARTAAAAGGQRGFLEKYMDFSNRGSDEDILSQLSLNPASLASLGASGDLDLHMEVESDTEAEWQEHG